MIKISISLRFQEIQDSKDRFRLSKPENITEDFTWRKAEEDTENCKETQTLNSSELGKLKKKQGKNCDIEKFKKDGAPVLNHFVGHIGYFFSDRRQPRRHWQHVLLWASILYANSTKSASLSSNSHLQPSRTWRFGNSAGRCLFPSNISPHSIFPRWNWANGPRMKLFFSKRLHILCQKFANNIIDRKNRNISDKVFEIKKLRQVVWRNLPVYLNFIGQVSNKLGYLFSSHQNRLDFVWNQSGINCSPEFKVRKNQ